MKRRIKSHDAYLVLTTKIIIASQENDKMLEQLSQLSLKAPQHQEKIHFLETQVKILQRETTIVQTPERLFGAVSRMFVSKNDEVKVLRVILIKKINQLESH